MSKVYIVPTPIGNLEDITIRAVNTLKKVDFILAEDTRNSVKLLQHFQIQKPLFAYHQHNEHHKTQHYIERIQQGNVVALISDSGTPGISDPGFMMIKACIENQIPIESLPGPTAFVPALLLSGFPNHEFLFAGFLPQKKGRQSKLKELSEIKKTIILYESPHKIEKTLLQITEFFSHQTPISISREITKIYEETLRGTAQELLIKVKQKPLKGEIVLVINNH